LASNICWGIAGAGVVAATVFFLVNRPPTSPPPLSNVERGAVGADEAERNRPAWLFIESLNCTVLINALLVHGEGWGGGRRGTQSGAPDVAPAAEPRRMPCHRASPLPGANTGSVKPRPG
jgi:hypothetical protein